MNKQAFFYPNKPFSHGKIKADIEVEMLPHERVMLFVSMYFEDGEMLTSGRMRKSEWDEFGDEVIEALMEKLYYRRQLNIELITI